MGVGLAALGAAPTQVIGRDLSVLQEQHGSEGFLFAAGGEHAHAIRVERGIGVDDALGEGTVFLAALLHPIFLQQPCVVRHIEAGVVQGEPGLLRFAPGIAPFSMSPDHPVGLSKAELGHMGWCHELAEPGAAIDVAWLLCVDDPQRGAAERAGVLSLPDRPARGEGDPEALDDLGGCGPVNVDPPNIRTQFFEGGPEVRVLLQRQLAGVFHGVIKPLET